MLGNPDRRTQLRLSLFATSWIVLGTSAIAAFASLTILGQDVAGDSRREATQARLKNQELLKLQTEREIADARAASGLGDRGDQLILRDWNGRKEYWKQMMYASATFQDFARPGVPLQLLDRYRRVIGIYYSDDSPRVCNPKTDECKPIPTNP